MWTCTAATIGTEGISEINASIDGKRNVSLQRSVIHKAAACGSGVSSSVEKMATYRELFGVVIKLNCSINQAPLKAIMSPLATRAHGL